MTTTVLVVDDDAEVRELLADILRGKYNVLAVPDAREALELLKLRIPDLVVCDIIMPGMSGFELLNRLKQDELTAHIPVMLLSSDTSVDSKIEGTNIGADAYLSKPFHEAYLLAVVDHLLSNRQKLKDYFNSPLSSMERVKGKLLHKEDKEFIHQLTKIVAANLDNEQFYLSEGDHGYVLMYNAETYQWNEERDYLWPIPQDQRIATGGALTQNPGY